MRGPEPKNCMIKKKKFLQAPQVRERQVKSVLARGIKPMRVTSLPYGPCRNWLHSKIPSWGREKQNQNCYLENFCRHFAELCNSRNIRQILFLANTAPCILVDRGLGVDHPLPVSLLDKYSFDVRRASFLDTVGLHYL